MFSPGSQGEVMRENRGFWHSHGRTKDRSRASVAAPVSGSVADGVARPVLQEQVIYLKAENLLLQEKIETKRIRFPTRCEGGGLGSRRISQRC